MPETSRVIVTVHPHDDEEFWNIIEHDRPDGLYQYEYDESGALQYDMSYATQGWYEELDKAAKAKLRFFGEDMGCSGVWGPQLFASANGELARCPVLPDVGPAASVNQDGVADPEDIKSAVAYYKAYEIAHGSIERVTFLRELDVGDEVTWTDPDDGKLSGVYKISKINAEDDQDREDAVFTINNDSGSEAEVFGHELS